MSTAAVAASAPCVLCEEPATTHDAEDRPVCWKCSDLFKRQEARRAEARAPSGYSVESGAYRYDPNHPDEVASDEIKMSLGLPPRCPERLRKWEAEQKARNARSCLECGKPTLDTPGPWCSAECAKMEREREHRAELMLELESWWRENTQGYDGLGFLPKWKCDYDDDAWAEKCNPEVLAFIRDWDPESSCAIIARTGEGKTSSIVARFREHYDQLKHLIQGSLERIPGLPGMLRERWQYVTGLDLREAERRRRLGQEHHALVDAACRVEVMFLDDVSTDAPADVVRHILDQRMRRGLHTFTVLAMSLREAGAYLGAPYLRRMVADGGRVLDLTGKRGLAVAR